MAQSWQQHRLVPRLVIMWNAQLWPHTLIGTAYDDDTSHDYVVCKCACERTVSIVLINSVILQRSPKAVRKRKTTWWMVMGIHKLLIWHRRWPSANFSYRMTTKYDYEVRRKEKTHGSTKVVTNYKYCVDNTKHVVVKIWERLGLDNNERRKLMVMAVNQWWDKKRDRNWSEITENKNNLP